MLIQMAPFMQNVRSSGNLSERIVSTNIIKMAHTAIRFTLVLSLEMTAFRSSVEALFPAI